MTNLVPEFEALITPHRSLGPTGLRRLVAFLLLLSAGVSTMLWFLGAWPVIGFNGVEMGLALALLYRNHRDQRRVERLVLSSDGLLVQRIGRRGKAVSRRLDAGWLQAVLLDRPGRTPALLLIDRGHRMEIGADLGEDEKRSLAAALRSALYRQRNPVFDNPQLR